MRFPTGLRARLVQRRFLRGFAGESAPAIFQLSPMVKHFPTDALWENAAPETEWHEPKACLQAAEQARAVAVWLSGTEPLFHPAIGEVAAVLADSGRYVFLHTSGVGLRKRIHEFKPVDRLYVTVEIPVPSSGARLLEKSSSSASFECAVEAIRVARLSGFHVCAHFSVTEAIASPEIAAQIRTLGPQQLDGALVSSGGRFLEDATSADLSHAVMQATKLIPSAAWRRFSRVLEASYRQLQPDSRQASERALSPRKEDSPAGAQSACEETA